MDNETTPVHVNRMGQSYYLQEGKTSSGKPKYYTGRKLTGKPLDAIPDGYEIHEKPDTGQVVVRKIKPSPISAFERRLAEEIVRRASGLDHFGVEIEGDALVVYTPSVSRAEHDDFVERMSGPFARMTTRMADEFRAVRIPLGSYGPLDVLVETYAKHLDQESFFDLMM